MRIEEKDRYLASDGDAAKKSDIAVGPMKTMRDGWHNLALRQRRIMLIPSQSSIPGLKAAIIVVLVAILGTYLVALSIDGERLDQLSWEDGLIEDLGAVFFLAATIGFAVVSLFAAAGAPLSAAPDKRRALVFGLLAVLMFVCLGEEISWGQRIFDWSTPESISELNAQNETNIHNIWFVHQWNRDGTEKGFVGKLLNMNRLFSAFWLIVFVFIPIAARLSARARRLFRTSEIPVPPLWAGGLFLGSFVVNKVLGTMYAGSIQAHALDEIKESIYAFIYAFIAIVSLVWAVRYRPEETDSHLECRGS